MRKKVAALVAVAIVIAVISLLVIASLGLFGEQKTTVNNLRFTQITPENTKYLRFSVTNAYNLPITSTELEINQVNCGSKTTSIPTSQTQEVAIPIADSIEISSTTTYSIKLTFLFEDGKTEHFSTNVVTGQFSNNP